MHSEPPSEGPGSGGLGTALRSVRRARGLSLAQVADETGISRSLLSLIETGRSDITIGRLNKLVRLYGVRLNDLLPEPAHHDPVVMRRHERPSVTSVDEGVDIEVLAPQRPRVMQPLLVRLAPGGGMTDYVVQPEEECVVVIEGRLRLEFAGGDALELDTGDSAYFRWEHGHRLVNLHDGVTRVVVVFQRPRPA